MYQYKGVVNRIVDGDTLDIQIDVGFKIYSHQRFRLLGYNAPETRGPERELGKIAKKHLEEYIPPGTEVVVVTYKADSFGRYLCDLYSHNGRNLVEYLIDEGYGVPWDGKGKRPGFDPDAPYPIVPPLTNAP